LNLAVYLKSGDNMSNKITIRLMLVVSLLLSAMSMQTWATDKIIDPSKEMQSLKAVDVKKAEMKAPEVKKAEMKTIEAKKAGISKIDINQASVDQLTTIKGIGKTKAQAIVDYRKSNGAFKKKEDLMQVKGIGAGTVKKITPYISY